MRIPNCEDSDRGSDSRFWRVDALAQRLIAIGLAVVVGTLAVVGWYFAFQPREAHSESICEEQYYGPDVSPYCVETGGSIREDPVKESIKECVNEHIGPLTQDVCEILDEASGEDQQCILSEKLQTSIREAIEFSCGYWQELIDQ
jgi:hypothetical protein